MDLLGHVRVDRVGRTKQGATYVAICSPIHQAQPCSRKLFRAKNYQKKKNNNSSNKRVIWMSNYRVFLYVLRTCGVPLVNKS